MLYLSLFELVSLTARSPVFNAMFEHEMEESKKVTITPACLLNLDETQSHV